MQRCIFSLLLFSFWLWLVPAQLTSAAPLPILKAGSKVKPHTAPPASTSSGRPQPGQQAFVSLGQAMSISQVKRRVGSLSKRVTLPRINRQISSKCVMVMDADSGRTLYALAPDTPRQPASTIKVLTGSIALKSLQDQDRVGVSRKASRMPRSKVYLDPRKKYLADDLINAVLLASANDASVALAEEIGGDERKFAHMMNLRAKFWGAKRTICKTASGLTARGQQSTARDLANIFRHAMKDPEFSRRMYKRKVTTSDGKTLYNHNKALWRVRGTQGGKTGYTAAARQTYVGQFSRDGETIIVAIMGSETMWSDVKKLVDYGFRKKQQIRLARAESSAAKEQTSLN